jgi:hypothetical protein
MMSLDYKLTDIKDYENLCWGCDARGEDYMNRKTEDLIFATMTIALGEITQKNHIEFYTRIMMYKFLSPSALKGITLDDVKAHIGLKTNVADTTPLKFNKKLGLMARGRIGWDIDYRQRMAEEESALLHDESSDDYEAAQDTLTSLEDKVVGRTTVTDTGAS